MSTNSVAEYSTDASIKGIGLLCHVYYMQAWPSIVAAAKKFPVPFTWLISTTEQQLEEVREQARAAVPEAQLIVKAVPNQGFDIAPFVITFKQELLELDLVCKLHTKQSVHQAGGTSWGEYLVQSLAGSQDRVKEHIRRFEEFSKMGVLFASHSPSLRNAMGWSNEHAKIGMDLLFKIGSSVPSWADYPTGSMFWFRPKAFMPLFDMNYDYADFDSSHEQSSVIDSQQSLTSDSNQLASSTYSDATLAHVIERSLLLVARNQEFTWQKLPSLGNRLSVNDQPTEARLKIAVVLHIWALAGLDKVIAALKNIIQPYDLIITDSSGNPEAIKEALGPHFENQSVDIVETENIGHDVRPFIDLGDRLSNYQLVCKLHLKPSAPQWLDYLLNNLLGGVAEVEALLLQFQRNTRLGLVYPPAFPPIQPYMGWGSNFRLARKLAQQMKLGELPVENVDYPSSTMFWCRPEALQTLFLGGPFEFSAKDNTKSDGTPSHAIERLLVEIVKANDFQSRTVLFHPYLGNPHLNMY